MLKKSVYIIPFLLLTSSCTTTRLNKAFIPAEEIQSMTYLPPFADIGYIEKGNRAFANDSISLKCELMITDILERNARLFRVGEPVNLIFSDDKQDAQFALARLVDQIVLNRNDISNITIQPELFDFIADNQRFAMGIMTEGFVRRPGNYAGQILASIGIGILTMGMYYPVPTKSISTVHVVILDRMNEQVVFYRRSMLTDKSPLDVRVVEKQLYKIFEGYFYE